MINWKLRIQNRATLWAIISLVVGLVYRILDALHVIPPFTADFVLEIAADILSLLGLLGVIVDPTTVGIEDSNRAQNYDHPWNDATDYDDPNG